MSRAAHHQVSIVDEAIDHTARTFIYGRDPPPDRRLAYIVFAGAIIRDVLLHAGEAINVVWGPPTFYVKHFVPMRARFDRTLQALDAYATARRMGLNLAGHPRRRTCVPRRRRHTRELAGPPMRVSR
jgi:hypothetical protein